jgi:hypothetical protein
MAVLLIGEGLPAEEAALAAKLVELTRRPGASVLSELVVGYFLSASSSYARHGAFADAIRTIKSLQIVVGAWDPLPEADFAIANCLVVVGTAAVEAGSRAPLAWARSELLAAFQRSGDVRTAGGLMFIDRGAIHYCIVDRDTQGAVSIASEMIDLWNRALCRFDAAADEVVKLLEDALSSGLRFIASQRDDVAVQTFWSSVECLDLTDSRLDRIKARMTRAP